MSKIGHASVNFFSLSLLWSRWDKGDWTDDTDQVTQALHDANGATLSTPVDSRVGKGERTS